jgi:hypothetical protein
LVGRDSCGLAWLRGRLVRGWRGRRAVTACLTGVGVTEVVLALSCVSAVFVVMSCFLNLPNRGACRPTCWRLRRRDLPGRPRKSVRMTDRRGSSVARRACFPRRTGWKPAGTQAFHLCRRCRRGHHRVRRWSDPMTEGHRRADQPDRRRRRRYGSRRLVYRRGLLQGATVMVEQVSVCQNNIIAKEERLP